MADDDTPPPTDVVRRTVAAVKRGNQPRGRGTIAPPDEPPRRLMAAGHVLLVGLICLSIGWALNAQGVKKTAHGQPIGWRRDVAVFFADPVASLSSFFQLSRPREALQSALGREGDDDINTALPSPTTPDAGGTTTTIQTAFSPDDPMRVWIGGDSLAIRSGESMIEDLPPLSGGAIEVVVPQIQQQVATGLARPEVLNWPEHLRSETERDDPDVVVLTVGINDAQPLTGEGGVGPFGTEEWQAEYRRRVGGLMDQVLGEGRTLVWVGIPIVRDGGRDAQFQVINEIVRSEAELREGRVLFVDIYEMFKDHNGNYAEYLANDAGEIVKYREPDGIHLTPAGGDRVAAEVFGTIAENFDLTSWRDDQPSTTASTAPVTTTPPP